MRFVDTNVLLYAVSNLADEAGKRRIAIELLGEPDLVVSVQVLQEFYFQATHPSRTVKMSHEDALRFLEPVFTLPIQAITLDVFHSAVIFSNRFGISYSDGAILAAARASGCDTVLSEDLSAEQDYDGLRVANPFSGA